MGWYPPVGGLSTGHQCVLRAYPCAHWVRAADNRVFLERAHLVLRRYREAGVEPPPHFSEFAAFLDSVENAPPALPRVSDVHGCCSLQ